MGLEELCVRVLYELFLLGRTFVGPGLDLGGGLLVELPPLLLGPPELLDGGGEVEEVDRDDIGPGSQVGVSDQGIQLAPGLDQS